MLRTRPMPGPTLSTPCLRDGRVPVFEDGVLHASPVYPTGERCQLAMVPPRRASGDLSRDAISLFQEATKEDPRARSGYPFPSPVFVRGTSADGWPYFMVRKSIHGQLDDLERLISVFVFLAQVDNQVYGLVGTSKDPLVSSCFGLQDVWPRLYHSLRLRRSLPPNQQAVQRKSLTGSWAGSVISYSFAPDGRYLFAGESKFGPTISETSTYTIDRNVLVVATKNGQQRYPFRVIQESEDLGRTWTDKLCMLMEGSPTEMCLNKDRSIDF
jgi:hypothetical protein